MADLTKRSQKLIINLTPLEFDKFVDLSIAFETTPSALGVLIVRALLEVGDKELADLRSDRLSNATKERLQRQSIRERLQELQAGPEEYGI